MVLLPNTDEQGALIVGEMIRAEVVGLGMAHEGNKAGPLVTISIGCCTYHGGDPAGIGQLLRKADEALYTAKKTGRNRVCAASLDYNHK